MLGCARFLAQITPKSILYNSPPLRRRRLFTSGIVKSIDLLPSRNPSSNLNNPFSTKMDRNTGAEPSVEDYVHLSDSDLRVATPSTKYGTDPEGDAASVSVDEREVRGEFEERRIGGSGEGGFEERRILPEELAKAVLHLECESSAEGGRCDVYLVGTAHVSQESCKEVQAVIRYLKPEVVFLELCSSRVAILTPQNLKVPTFNEMIDMWKKKKANTFGILYSWFLAKVAERLEVFPGAEFRVAFEEAVSYGARVFLGDRPVNITLRRTWGKMSIWHRAKFLYYIIFQTFFLPSPEDLNKMLKDMDDVDVLTLVIQEMSKAFPTIMETVLHERDIYMSSKLLKVASEHSSVVAIVGKGHLPGIRKNWKQPVDVKLLLQITGTSAAISKTKIIAAGVAVAGVAAAYSIYLMGKR
ncbi:traB domain-containing protein [Phalaenopsis equestris]|uniref:traB domain-containing protein n=1 Tax=Phalaenopsis equestris TaxID=78828 RepID=UPI0009E3ACAE|nr:traB domain-containing protein [Phalaenopsis equestris]